MEVAYWAQENIWGATQEEAASPSVEREDFHVDKYLLVVFRMSLQVSIKQCVDMCGCKQELFNLLLSQKG